MSLTRTQLLATYRRLLRLSADFGIYNYREYAKRRVRDGFRNNKFVTDLEKVSKLHSQARASVNLLERQTKLNGMYAIDKLVLET